MLGLSRSMPMYDSQNRKFDTIYGINPYIYETEINPVITVKSNIAWYDFTDQQTIYKDVAGITNIHNNDKIGRINNKARRDSRRLGIFLRDFESDGIHGNGDSNAPTYKTGGVNGFSYAQFTSGTTLAASDLYLDNLGSANFYHGGGVGDATNVYENGYYGGFKSNGESGGIYDNFFSDVGLQSDAITVFWVVEPTVPHNASDDQTHWVIRPMDSNDIGNDRSKSVYWEGFTDEPNNEFNIRCGFPDHSSGSGATYTTSGISLETGINVIHARFNDGTNEMVVDKNGGDPAGTTISESTTYNLMSGMMTLGGWSVAADDKTHLSNSSFLGKFYEILVFDRDLSNTETTELYVALLKKYGID